MRHRARIRTAACVLAGTFLLTVTLGCARVGRWFGPKHARPWRWSETREDYVAASQVWLGGDLGRWRARMPSLDLGRGPEGPDHIGPEEVLRCEYVEPEDDTFAGATPKFLCARDGAEPFKVKWGAENGEVYAEVAGSRLLWALGFPGDAVYPVSVECTGCADDPWRDRERHPGRRPPPFSPAIVERKFPGKTIAELEHQGWRWDELPRVDPARGGAPRAHVDALRLLAAFIQHRDSKDDNQRLVCLPGRIESGGAGRLERCSAPVLMIQDLGSAFGGPTLVATSKMDLAAWEQQPVWKDPARCIANLTHEPDARGGLRNPEISDEGRRFLGDLLAGLSDAQLRALFTAARADRRGGVDRWVTAFRRKRDAVLAPMPGDPAFRCPR